MFLPKRFNIGDGSKCWKNRNWTVELCRKSDSRSQYIKM